MKCEIELKPAYVACVSGGKDSLLMLQVIIKNRDKYPLDYVRRCGCMMCPFVSNIELAYMLKYYPEAYTDYIRRLKETEVIRESETGRPFAVRQGNPKYNAEYTDNIVRTKWLKKLEEMEKEYDDN